MTVAALRKFRLSLGLKGKIIALVFIVVFISLALSTAVTGLILRRYIEEGIAEKLLTAARFVASQQDIQRAMLLSEPWKVIQPKVRQIIDATGIDIIVVINMEGIRYAHLNDALIGKTITGGDEGPALEGKTYFSRAYGISGYTLRVFTPMYDSAGKQIGAVSAGALMKNVLPKVHKALLALALVMLTTLGVGSAGAVFLARHIKKAIMGFEPGEIAALLQERNAMLDSIREGVVAVDRHGKVTLVNRAAKEILIFDLGFQEEILGKSINHVINMARLPEVVVSGQAELDEEMTIGNTTILTNRVPVEVNGEIIGAIATFRDLTELNRLAEELTGIREYTEALRAQSHEFHNKLHTIAGLIELEAYQEAYEYIAEITDVRQDMAHQILTRCRDHLVAGLLIGKISQGKERGIELEFEADECLANLPKRYSQSLVTILGNLIQNSFEAVEVLPVEQRIVRVSIWEEQETIWIQVADRGLGIPTANLARIFEKNFSTKPEHSGTGLFLVKHFTEALKGSVQVYMLEPGVEFRVRIPREAKEDDQVQSTDR